MHSGIVVMKVPLCTLLQIMAFSSQCVWRMLQTRRVKCVLNTLTRRNKLCVDNIFYIVETNQLRLNIWFQLTSFFQGIMTLNNSIDLTTASFSICSRSTSVHHEEIPLKKCLDERLGTMQQETIPKLWKKDIHLCYASSCILINLAGVWQLFWKCTVPLFQLSGKSTFNNEA